MHPKRRSYHHGALRQALIDAALARLSKNDSTEISLRALAADVRVSPMAVYRHFADLDGLLAAVATRGFEMLTEYLNAVQNQAKTRLEQLGLAYVDFAHANPGIYRLIFRENHFGTAEDPELRSASLKAFDTLVATVAETLPTRRRREARDIAHTLWSGLHGAVELASNRLVPAGEADLPERRLELIRIVWRHLLDVVK